jgi:cytochrome oxidase Cu insertion factor (SCO1/SenC/PrrC family)
MEHIMKRVCLASVCLIIGLGGCVGSQERQFVAAVKGKPATDFTLTSLGGEDVRLSQFHGQPVVLAFWAST